MRDKYYKAYRIVLVAGEDNQGLEAVIVPKSERVVLATAEHVLVALGHSYVAD